MIISIFPYLCNYSKLVSTWRFRYSSILPVVVGGNGKDVLNAPATRYVGSGLGTQFQLSLNVINNPRIVNFRISRYYFMAYADLIGLVFTCA